MVGGVVGKGRPRNPYDARRDFSPRCSAVLATNRRGTGEGLLAVTGSRRNYDVLVPQLARKMTLMRKMASNASSTLGVEFGDVERLHAIAPFAALAARLGRPLRVAILSDFVRIPYANGAAFQTRFLYQELRRCGYQVTVIGPHDPEAHPDELAPGTVSLPSVPLKTYPGVYIPLPLASWIYDIRRWDFDIVFGQTTSMLMRLGTWLRRMKGIPLLCVNTTHLAAAYAVLLPERLSKIEVVQLRK